MAGADDDVTPRVAPTPETVADEVDTLRAAAVVLDASTPVGTLPGAASVDARGQANYRIPIVPTPGVGAMTPSLALAYNSGAGNGIAGMGFTLEGQSAVRRCPRSLLRDGAWEPLHWDASDALCLDGDRLVLEVGAYGSDGSTYRPAHDPSRRVVLHGALDGPVTWFELFEGDGRIRQYGTPAAALWRASNGGEMQPYVWALLEERDRFDNEIRYVYSHPLVLPTGPAQLQLDEIRYGGTGSVASQRKIRFHYTGRTDQIDAWFFGAHTRMTTRLSSIDVEGPSGQLVRRYELDYDADPDSNRSRVIAARVCDAADVCLPDTTFTWDAPIVDGWESSDFEIGEILFGLMQVEVLQLIGAARQVLMTDLDGDLTQEIMFRRDAAGAEPWTVWNPQGIGDVGCPTGSPPDCEPPPELTDFSMLSPPLVDDDLDEQIQIPSTTDENEQDAFGLALRRYRPALGPTVISFDGDRRSDLLMPRNPTAYLDDPLLDDDGQIYANGLYLGLGVDPEVGFELVDIEDGFDARIYDMVTLDHDGDHGTDAWLCRGSSYRDATWTLALRSQDAPNGFEWFATDIGCSIHDELSILPMGSGGQRLLVIPAYDDDGDPIDDDARVAYQRLELDVASGTAGLFASGLPRDRYQRWHDNRCRNGLAHAYSGLTVFSAGLGNDKLIDVNGDGLVDVLRFELAVGDGVDQQDDIVQGLPLDAGDALSAGWDDPALCTAEADDEQDGGIRLYTNTGEGFLPGPFVTELDGIAHASYWLNFVGAQQLDFEDDGLVDVALPSTGVDGEWTVLRSHGDGTFLAAAIGLPAGWPAYTANDDWREQLAAGRRARIFTLQTDRRSPGELLFVGQVGDEPSETWPAPVNLWRRSADYAVSVGRLRAIVDGLGHDVTFDYEGRDVSDLDVEVHEGRVDAVPVPGAMFVVSRMSEGATRWDFATNSHARTQRLTRYGYAGAVIGRLGGGLMGFSDVNARVYGEGKLSTLVHTRYSHDFDAELMDWTEAGRPLERLAIRVVDGPKDGIEYGALDDHALIERTTWTWSTVATALAGGTTSLTYAGEQRVRAYDKSCSDPIINGCSWPEQPVLFDLDGATPYRDATRTEVRDAYGTPTSSSSSTWLGETVTRAYLDISHDTEDWLLGRVGTMTTTSCSYGGECKTQTSSSTYDATTGALATTTIEPGDPVLELETTLVRSAHGNVINLSSSGGGVLRWRSTSYDAEGVFPESFTNQLGQTSYVIHHPASGVVLAEVDVAGATERNSFDGFLRPTGSTLHASPLGADDGAATSIQYLLPDPLEALSAMRMRVVDRMGQRTTTHVLPTGEPVLRTWWGMAPVLGALPPNGIPPGLDVEQRYAYDVFGNGAAVSVPKWAGAGGDTYWTEQERDPAGNLIRTIAPDTTVVAGVQYSALPAMIGSTRVDHTDAAGNLTTRIFDGDGALVTSIDAVGVSTCFTPGAFGQLTRVRRNCGGTRGPHPVTVMTYDAYGRVLTETDPAFGTRRNTWNAFGDLVERSYASGESTSFHYDTLGRVDRTTDSDGHTWFTWDEARPGLLAWTQTPDDVFTSYDYDDWGRTLREHTTVPSSSGADDYVFEYDWGDGPRLEQIHYPAVDGEPAFVVRVRLDQPGYLRGVDDPGTGLPWWIARTGNASAQIETEDYGNGVTTTRTWNAKRGWLEHVVTSNGVAMLQDLAYTWKPAGELDHRIDAAGAPGITQREDFVYDANWRLKQTTLTRGPTKFPATTVSYDEIGNITAKPGVGAYSYDGDGTVLTADGTSVFHDLDGNVIAHGTRTLTHTPFQKVESITSAGKTRVFAYDADGRRVRRRDSSDGSDTISIGDRYERVVGPTGTTKSITYRIPAGDRMVAQFTRTAAGGGAWTLSQTRLHDDHLGSTNVMSNTSGASSTAIAYDAWGRARNNSDWTALLEDATASKVAMGFTGHRAQQDSGLIDMRGRMYDPKLGQFFGTDPIVADPARGTSWNRYSYVENRPLLWTDPSGYAPDTGGGLGDAVCEGHKNCSVDGDGNPTRQIFVPAAPDSGAGTIGWRSMGAYSPWGFADSTSGADVMQMTRSQLDRMQKLMPNVQFVIVRSRLEAEALSSLYPPAPKKPWKNPFGNLLEFADALETGAQVGLFVASFVNPVAAAAATALDLGDAAVAASNGDYGAMGLGLLDLATPGHLPSSKLDEVADGAKAAKGFVGSVPKTPTGPGAVPKSERDPQRFFTPDARAAKREAQGHACPGCGTTIDASNSQGHHIQRHADGGPTTSENHVEVCIDCHVKIHGN